MGEMEIKLIYSQLCHSHIIATAQRAQPSRIVAVLTSDFREFVGSGMLTLKSKFETLEEGKIIARAAEVWSFFWGQVLPVSVSLLKQGRSRLTSVLGRCIPAFYSDTRSAIDIIRRVDSRSPSPYTRETHLVVRFPAPYPPTSRPSAHSPCLVESQRPT